MIRTTTATRSDRWYWLDWLRILAMGTIFLYHSGRPFVIFEWAVMSPEPDMAFTLVNVFVTGWIMPLFFVISGIATYFSLTKRNPRQYAVSRFKRLMIPFIFALFFILPVHRYYDALFDGYFTESFRDFYFWEYFKTKSFPFSFDISSTYFADSNWGTYLWYIFWLFIFSLITVHFFKWLRNEGNRSKISKLATTCNRFGGIFLLAIPLIIVDILAVRPYFIFPSGYGGWKLPTYLAFFIIAYILASDSKFEKSIERNRIFSLLVGIVTSVAIILLFAILQEGLLSYYVPWSILWVLNGWCWVITIIGFGRKLLNFNHRFLGMLNELVLPFYILHETVIVAVAFYVISFDLDVSLQYLIIASASFAIIAIILLPVMKIKVLRFLFGMRLKK